MTSEKVLLLFPLKLHPKPPSPSPPQPEPSVSREIHELLEGREYRQEYLSEIKTLIKQFCPDPVVLEGRLRVALRRCYPPEQFVFWVSPTLERQQLEMAGQGILFAA